MTRLSAHRVSTPSYRVGSMRCSPTVIRRLRPLPKRTARRPEHMPSDNGSLASATSDEMAPVATSHLSPVGVLDRCEATTFGLLRFLPTTSVLRSLSFQHVVAARFLSDAAQEGIAYGAVVATVRSGGS